MTAPAPDWFAELLGIPGGTALREGGRVEAGGQVLELRRFILRQLRQGTDSQSSTSDTFGFKWNRRDTFEGRSVQDHAHDWLVDRYGAPSTSAWWAQVGPETVLLDAGCGAGHTALAYFGDELRRVRYLGVDVSNAVEVARDRFAEAGIEGAFLQADICDLPLAPESVDIIYSEGVMHHTDSTEAALRALARHLKPAGWFLFYVYRRKGPIREFCDDYIRNRLQGLDHGQAWELLMPLTKLGKALGEIDCEIEVPEAVELLGIPAGRMSVQRLFYYYVFKAFYRPEFTLDEMNHINFDWYAPQNAHRQSPAEVEAWCRDAGLEIVTERVEEAGITIVARRAGRP